MGFHHISAPVGTRVDGVLSADNGQPDRFSVIEAVRRASAPLGLKAPVIATLDALLSCLPPKRSHNFVFASNATLAFRRNGISDRTLRRHIALLAALGFLIRHDSPNCKRFTRDDPITGQRLHFGFDLTPLFTRHAELTAMARECDNRAAHLAFLRLRLRAAIARALALAPASAPALSAQKALRRSLSADQLQQLLDQFADPGSAAPVDIPVEEASEMATTGGQNDRHHQKQKKEIIESKDAGENANTACGPICPEEVVSCCPEAASFLTSRPRSTREIIGHALLLAPMMGIDRATYAAAEQKQGGLGAALTVWGLLQLQGRVRQLGAYFRAITSGARSDGFDPVAFLRRLPRHAAPAVG